jgi:hypothetical protein
MLMSILLTDNLGAASNIPLVTRKSNIDVLANTPVELRVRGRLANPRSPQTRRWGFLKVNATILGNLSTPRSFSEA